MLALLAAFMVLRSMYSFGLKSNLSDAEKEMETDEYVRKQRYTAVSYYDRNVYDTAEELSEPYSDTGLTVGIVPHHATAAKLISSFFKSVDSNFDAVIVIGPNHSAAGGSIVYSDLSFSTEYGNINCCEKLNRMIAEDIELSALLDNNIVKTEHSCGILIPYIADKCPDAELAIILLSGNIGEKKAQRIAELIKSYGEDKNILLIGSADFSHNLTPQKAKQNDEYVKDRIERNDYNGIFKLDSGFLDSPQTVAVILKYAQAVDKRLKLLEKSMSYTERGIDENLVEDRRNTTTYLVYGV